MHVLIDSNSTGLKVFGASQWLEDKHDVRSRRRWCKLHLAVDADNGEIIAHRLTDQDSGDLSQVEPLLDQIDGEIGQFTANGAYDGCPTYGAVLQHAPPHGLSFRHGPRQWMVAGLGRPIKETATSGRLPMTVG